MPNKKAMRNNNRKEKRAPPPVSTRKPCILDKAINQFARHSRLNVGPKTRRNRMRIVVNGKIVEMKYEDAIMMCLLTNPNKDCCDFEVTCHH